MKAYRKQQSIRCHITDKLLTGRLSEEQKYKYVLAKRNRREVQARLWKARQESAIRRFANGTPDQLRNFLTSWLKVRRPSLKPGTYKAYRLCLNRYLLPLLGDLPWQEITEEQIYSCLHRALPHQLQSIQSIVSQMLIDAVTWKHLMTHPCEALTIARKAEVDEHGHLVIRDGGKR